MSERREALAFAILLLAVVALLVWGYVGPLGPTKATPTPTPTWYYRSPTVTPSPTATRPYKPTVVATCTMIADNCGGTPTATATARPTPTATPSPSATSTRTPQPKPSKLPVTGER